MDIHHHHVGPVLADKIKRRLTVGYGADNVDLRIRFEEVHEEHSSHRRVLRHQYFDLALGHESFRVQISRRTASIRLL